MGLSGFRGSPRANVKRCGASRSCGYAILCHGGKAVEEAPTPQDIEEISKLAGQSIKEGAVGFSVNRLKAHRLPDGRCIPGTFAPEEELVAIAKEVGAAGGFCRASLNRTP